MAAGRKVCAIDVPMVVSEPKVGPDGVYLGGWATHDLISRAAAPERLWHELSARHGAPVMPGEMFGRQDPAGLARLREQLLHATDQLATIAVETLQGGVFDLACIVFGAAHRGGHYLYDLSQIDPSGLGEPARGRLTGALAEIYQRIDAALGRVLAAADPGATVIVFALHGMTRNHGMADHFADLLGAMERIEAGRPAKHGLLYRIKRAIPSHWLSPLLTRLPPAFNHHLASLWSARMHDWRHTTHFALPMDLAGYVRINLAGRERDGIVAPGRSYDALRGKLDRLIRGLRDAATGRPLVLDVEHAWAAAAPGDEQHDVLPDLLVRRAPAGDRPVRAVNCDALPGFRYELPERLPSGRAGNHRARAWFIAAGPGTAAGQDEGGAMDGQVLPFARRVAA